MATYRRNIMGSRACPDTTTLRWRAGCSEVERSQSKRSSRARGHLSGSPPAVGATVASDTPALPRLPAPGLIAAPYVEIGGMAGALADANVEPPTESGALARFYSGASRGLSLRCPGDGREKAPVESSQE